MLDDMLTRYLRQRGIVLDVTRDASKAADHCIVMYTPDPAGPAINIGEFDLPDSLGISDDKVKFVVDKIEKMVLDYSRKLFYKNAEEASE